MRRRVLNNLEMVGCGKREKCVELKVIKLKIK
jgi:hypothetical protein